MRQLALVSCVAFVSSVYADNLSTIYRFALHHNHQYAASLLQKDIREQERKEAVSAFLPHVNFVFDGGYLHSTTAFDQKLSYFPALPIEINAHGGMYNFGLKAEQIIFDYAAIKRLAAAEKLKSAETIAQRYYRQKLMFLIAKDYFSVLGYQDNIRYLSAESNFYEHQLRVARDNKKFGKGTILDIDEAITSYRMTQTALIAAKAKFREAASQLRMDSGRKVSLISRLSSKFTAAEPKPYHLSDWQRMAMQDNVELAVARIKLKAAKDNIGIQKAQGYPVAFVAAGIGHSRVFTPVFQRLRVSSQEVIGGLKLPIYSGGFITATIKKAKLEYEKDYLKYDEAISRLKTGVDDVYSDLVDLNAKLRSDQTALKTALKTRESAVNAYRVGLGSMSNVLVGEKLYFHARSEARRDLYDYILLKFKLQELTGRLNDRFLASINRWLNRKPERI